MATEYITTKLSRYLNNLMHQKRLKLEYVAACARIGIETVRRVKNGEVSKLWDRTAFGLAEFIEHETDGEITANEILSEPSDSPDLFYQMLIEQNKDGIYVIQDQHIIFANHSITEMTGYSPEELQAHQYARFLDPQSRRFEKEQAQKKRRGEKIPSRFPVHVIRKDGGTLSAEAHVGKLFLNGKKGVLGTLRTLSQKALTPSSGA